MNGNSCIPFQMNWTGFCRLRNLDAGLEQPLGVDAMRAELGLRLFSVIADSGLDGSWRDMALPSKAWSPESGTFPSGMERGNEPAPEVPLSCCARTPGSGPEGNNSSGFPTAKTRDAMRKKKKRAMGKKELVWPIT